MNRILLGAAFALASTATVARDIVIVVPLEISGLPPDVQSARVECLISRSADRNPSQVMGQQTTYVPLVNGRYSGQIRVRILPGGYPRSVNPIPDVGFYRCQMDFWWTCTSSSGGEGVCVHRPGPEEGTGPGAALFRRAEGRPFTYRIEGVIDPRSAVQLPRRDL